MATRAPDQFVPIPADRVTLEGELALPPEASGVVVFAHGGQVHPLHAPSSSQEINLIIRIVGILAEE